MDISWNHILDEHLYQQKEKNNWKSYNGSYQNQVLVLQIKLANIYTVDWGTLNRIVGLSHLESKLHISTLIPNARIELWIRCCFKH